MPEDAFERFRRLRAVSPAGAESEQTQPTADTAPILPLALYQALHACGVRLTPALDGTLHSKAPKGTLTPALLDAIREHKEALLDLVEWYEERAGLLEYEAGMPRPEAEQEAWRLLEETYGRRAWCGPGGLPRARIKGFSRSEPCYVS